MPPGEGARPSPDIFLLGLAKMACFGDVIARKMLNIPPEVVICGR